MSDFFSYWEKSSYWQDADVVVIGSGIVGLSAAIHLKKTAPSKRIIVIERGIIPHGASSRNAGFACFGSVSELLDDIKYRGIDATLQLVERRYKGLLNLRQLIGDQNMRYEALGGFEVFDDKEIFEHSREMIPELNQALKSITGKTSTYAINADKISRSGMKGFSFCIENTAEGQLHSGLLMECLAQIAAETGVKIYSGIEVKSIENNQNGFDCLLNEQQILRTKKILIATNGFAKHFLPEEDIEPARGQIMVTAPIQQLSVKGAFHYDAGYYYFRNIDNRILIGGGRNLDFKGENTTAMHVSLLIQDALEKLLAEKILPNTSFQITHRWAGIMGVGKDKHPIIKKVNENLFAAVKMGGMGVAIGTLAGKEVADLILKDG